MPRVKYWSPAVLWMVMIFLMSTDSFSAPNTSSVIEPLIRLLFPAASAGTVQMVHGALRKAGHVIEYFVLGLLYFRAFRGGSPVRWQGRWAALSVLAVLAYAATDEFHQSFAPSRTASVIDVAIDAAGGLFSQALLFLRHRCGRSA